MRISIHNAIFITGLLLIGYLSLKSSGAYDSKRFRPFLKEVQSCFSAPLFNSAYILIIGYIFQSRITSVGTALSYGLICFSMLLVNRVILYLILRMARNHGRNLRNVFIAGTNARAIRLSKELPKLGYVVKGFIDKSWGHHPQKDIPLILDFNKALREQHVDEVIICLPIKTEYKFIHSIIEATEEQGILTRLSTDLFDLKIAKAKIEYFDEVPLLTLFTGNMYRRMVWIKRAIDTVIASILFILFLPVFVLTAVAVKLTSKGPIFFFQERLGMNKRLFKVIKFRTMVPDAEAQLKDLEHLNERKGEAAFKIKKDPRVTSIGTFLRMFSIDELPQLINVIIGDMSLVGPRPLPVRDYRGFNKDWQRRRFSVKPGITCIWQISGRDNVSFEAWMKMDNQYIDTWSLWLDLKILLKTLPAVLFKKGSS